ncbi:tRNA pseudouridine synthase B [Spirochaetia bacterium]|nr:tRNA pseudouridine synthase B [Spirochaetia bacterium]
MDKFASGLLLVLLGRAAKLTPWASGCDKHYEGVIRLGIETDTLDPEGSPVAEAAVPSREALEAALPAFRGDILQAPPVYSAIHIDGERAYALARSGKTVEMPKRPVTIYELELVVYEPPLAHIRVHCSKGTYIRSLARDLALAAGSRGHLISLNRTQVAGFHVRDAVDVGPDETQITEDALKPIDTGVFEALGLPYLETDEVTITHLIQGKPLAPLIHEDELHVPAGSNFTEQGFAAGIFHDNRLAAVVEKQAAGTWTYGYVYA